MESSPTSFLLSTLCQIVAYPPNCPTKRESCCVRGLKKLPFRPATSEAL